MTLVEETWVLKRWRNLFTDFSEQRSKKNKKLEDFLSELQRLTLVHEAGGTGDHYRFEASKGSSSKDNVSADEGKPDKVKNTKSQGGKQEKVKAEDAEENGARESEKSADGVRNSKPQGDKQGKMKVEDAQKNGAKESEKSSANSNWGYVRSSLSTTTHSTFSSLMLSNILCDSVSIQSGQRS